MYNFFVPAPTNIEDLKKMYRQLAMEHHPDRGGSEADMKCINSKYDTLFARLKDVPDGTEYKSAEATTETPEEYRDIINTLITIPDIIIELVGRWIWITGNTYAVKDQLKNAGCKFAGKKKAWYWHGPDDGVERSTKMTLEQIKEKYGASEIARTPSTPKYAIA